MSLALKNKLIIIITVVTVFGVIIGISVVILSGNKEVEFRQPHVNKMESDILKENSDDEVFVLDPSTQLINVKDRHLATFSEVFGTNTKLVFRYFGVNCNTCISEIISLLQLIYKDDFFSDVVLLNNSYIKTYMTDSLYCNEFYLSDLNNNVEQEDLPYFFTIRHNDNMKYRVTYVVDDLDDIESTKHYLEMLINNEIVLSE